MMISEFHVLKLKIADGRTIDVPLVIIKSNDGKIIKKMSYKQYKENSKCLPPLKPCINLKYLLEQKKKVVTECRDDSNHPFRKMVDYCLKNLLGSSL